MNLFRRKKDADLWRDIELWVLFPDRSLRVDKNPRVVGKVIISEKFEMIFRRTDPLRWCEWLPSKELGAQPVPTNKYVWVMTGGTAERPSEEEFQEACELAYLDATNRALEASNKRRWAVWWVAIGGSTAVVLLNFAKFFDVLRG